jgi:ABC-2 type transport system permease protein
MRTGKIFWLGTKELRSFMHDFVLLGLVGYALTLAVISNARSFSQEVHPPIAIVDEDHCALSRRITGAFLPPYLRPARPIAEHDIVPLLNSR